MEQIVTPRLALALRVERVITTCVRDGLEFQNNTWLVGDDHEAVVIDPAHGANPTIKAIGNRNLLAIVCTHGHWDHITAAVALRERTRAPIYLESMDGFLWDQVHDVPWDADLADGLVIYVAGHALLVRTTPGHTQGACVVYAPDLGVVFTGDTLFEGGPGATRWPYSSFTQIIESITSKILTLPDDTMVLTGHGPATSIARERADVPDWIARGY